MTTRPGRPRLIGLAGLALALVAAACSTAQTALPSPGVPTDAPTPAPTTQPSSSATPQPSIEGFPFAADDIVGYYESIGYTCTPEQPSSTAAGYVVRTCSLLDPDGRTRDIGVVTDPDGLVANGFAAITGTSDETILDPLVAFEPFAAFLGAMLGEDQGAAVVPWLAGHLGDAYEETTIGSITVATYSETPEDHSKLYIEVANEGYLSASSPPP